MGLSKRLASHPRLLGLLWGLLLLLASAGTSAAKILYSPKMVVYIGP